MNYNQLRRIRDELLMKSNKTQDEEELLQELQSLKDILNKFNSSLSLSNDVCKSCGRKF